MGDSTICTSSVLMCLLGFQGRGGLPVTTTGCPAQQTVIAHDGPVDCILALRRSTTPGGGRSSTGGTVVKHEMMALGSSPYRVQTLKLGLQPFVLAAKLGDLLHLSGRPNMGSQSENTARGACKCIIPHVQIAPAGAGPSSFPSSASHASYCVRVYISHDRITVKIINQLSGNARYSKEMYLISSSSSGVH